MNIIKAHLELAYGYRAEAARSAPLTPEDEEFEVPFHACLPTSSFLFVPLGNEKCSALSDHALPWLMRHPLNVYGRMARGASRIASSRPTECRGEAVLSWARRKLGISQWNSCIHMTMDPELGFSAQRLPVQTGGPQILHESEHKNHRAQSASPRLQKDRPTKS
jgi:hypothetical protein